MDSDIYVRLSRLEAMVTDLYARLGFAVPSPAAMSSAQVPEDVLALVRQGNKIAAIKRYRELTGADLASAKDTIDQLGY
ncbi:MAG: hypothetical protein QM733_22270 [Ilumatobacteraceae bacterium]